jgi:hypothetical protein
MKTQLTVEELGVIEEVIMGGPSAPGFIGVIGE